jgi:acetylornithine/succinyldiaminopimelate/putrescine aminotransferase
MVGVELDREGKTVVMKMMEKGVLANCTADRVIRFLPPLNIEIEDLERAVDVFVESLREVCGDG